MASVRLVPLRAVWTLDLQERPISWFRFVRPVTTDADQPAAVPTLLLHPVAPGTKVPTGTAMGLKMGPSPLRSRCTREQGCRGENVGAEEGPHIPWEQVKADLGWE